jgi:glycosyltransferase involved in cell wall biosynthesis
VRCRLYCLRYLVIRVFFIFVFHFSFFVCFNFINSEIKIKKKYGILREIINFKPDVIHCVEHTPASTFCGSLAKILNIPIVWSSHTNLDYYIPLYIHPFVAPLSLRIYQLLRRKFLNMADYNMSVSSDFVNLLNENGVKQTVHVWKTGVDSESFNPKYRSNEMRMRMFNGHYSSDKILLVSVGRISPEKNFDFLLKVLERCPSTFLCVVGGGPYRDSLEPLFPKERSHFIGFLQGEQLAAAYASADYFIYASVSETFGQVYLEAMASGTPIVAAEGKQMKEFFINGIHGYTWKPGDVDSAVRALNNAIRDRNMLAQNCRSHALNHSWNSAANQIADVYSKFRPVSIQDDNNNNNNNKINYNYRKHERHQFKFGLIGALRVIARASYFSSIWFGLMILVLMFMAPFMKVAKPSKENIDQTQQQNIKTNAKEKETTIS